MNARTPEVSPVGLSLAAGNAAVLRVLAEGPWTGSGSDLARQAGVDAKNIGRTLTNFYREGLARHVLADDPKPSGEGDQVEITEAGRHALSVADFAAGRAAPSAGPAADPDNDVLLLAHHQMRPNPLNPRKLKLGEPGDDPPTKDRRELDELKATIVAAGDVLQNLVVFPAGEDGVHDLSAGERRWRAVGELIEEGFWPRDRRLRAIEKANDPGRVSFLALVENGQRASLGKIEEARAFQALCTETGWSARKAAEHCGRDARTVQQFLQVLRDAHPDDIARHEANPEAYTWDELRKSVQKGAEADADDGARDPNQVDLEEAVGAGLPYELDAHYAGLVDYHTKNIGALSRQQLMMLVELADKVLRDPIAGHPTWTQIAEEHLTKGVTSEFILAGAGFQTEGRFGDPDRRPVASLAPSAMEVLRRKGLLTVLGDRAAILEHVRREAGVAEAKVQEAAAQDAYVTTWLDPQWRPERKPADPGPGPIIGGTGSVQPPRPARQAASPETELKAVERLAMAELAYHIRTRPDGLWGDDPVARVFKYWLDQTSSDLREHGFLVFNHVMRGGPFAALTKAGWAWVDANFSLLNASAITVERQKAGLPPEGDGYSTPWLNEPEGEAPGREPGEVTAEDVELARAAGDDDAEELARRFAEQQGDGAFSNEELDAQEEQTAQLLLDDVRATLAAGASAEELQALLVRAGLQRPFWTSQADYDEGEAGIIYDNRNREAAVADTNGERPHAEAQARAELLAYCLNLATRPAAKPDADAPEWVRLIRGFTEHAIDFLSNPARRGTDPAEILAQDPKDTAWDLASAARAGAFPAALLDIAILNARISRIDKPVATIADAFDDYVAFRRRQDGEKTPLLAIYQGDLVNLGSEASDYRVEGLNAHGVLQGQRISRKNGQKYGAPQAIPLASIQKIVARAKAEG